jgi:hypothetical protein
MKIFTILFIVTMLIGVALGYYSGMDFFVRSVENATFIAVDLLISFVIAATGTAMYYGAKDAQI